MTYCTTIQTDCGTIEITVDDTVYLILQEQNELFHSVGLFHNLCVFADACFLGAS